MSSLSREEIAKPPVGRVETAMPGTGWAQLTGQFGITSERTLIQAGNCMISRS
jgi:hypothetical protein